MKKYTIGIDFGSLSARATLTEASSGKEIAGAEHAYIHAVMTEQDICGELPRDTTALQDPEDYLTALGDVVRRVIRDSGISKDEVGALAIDFTASNILPILKDGTPLKRLAQFSKNPHAYVKMWKHHGATEEAAILSDVAREHFPEMLEPYGGIISSEWCFAKIFETLRKSPEVYYAADAFIEAGDWITLMLTGSTKRSACFAGYKAQWSAEGGYPEKKFFRMCEKRLESIIDERMAGEVIDLGECAGVLNNYGSELTGLPVGTRISTAIIDAHAALPAVGAVTPGDLMIIMGTSACHILISDKKLPARGICGRVKGGVVPGLYAYEAGQTAVGDALAWLTKGFIPASYENEAAEMRIGIFELLDKKAKEIAPGESGLLAIDWWNGCRSPYADYDLSGLLVGLTLRTPPEAIYRAIIESIAFGTRRIVEEFSSVGLAPRRIIISGGIAKKNAFIMQTVADILGMDIFVSDITQAGAHGSAIYASLTSGAYKTLQDAAEKMSSKDGVVYHASPEHKAIYDSLYHDYVELSEYFHKTNGVMRRLRARSSKD